MNYLEIVTHLIEPIAKARLSGFFKDPSKLDEKEQKLLESYSAMLFNISMVEKAIAETQAFVNDAERVLSGESKGGTLRAESSSAFASEEELREKPVQPQSLQSLLDKLQQYRNELNALQEEREALDQQHQEFLGEVKGAEIKHLQDFGKTFNVTLTDNQAIQVLDFHAERAAEKAERQSTFVNKAIKPVLEPQLLPQKKGDIDTKEMAEERAYRSQILQQAIPRLGENYSMATQIQLNRLLKEMLGPDVRLGTILKMTEELGGSAQKYESFVAGLKTDYQKTAAKIEEKVNKLEGRISGLESELGRRATTGEILARVETQEGEAAKTTAPTPLSTKPTPST